MSRFLRLAEEKNMFWDEEGLSLPRPEADDKILTLSTCTEDSSDTERFVIHGVLSTQKKY